MVRNEQNQQIVLPKRQRTIAVPINLQMKESG